MNPKGPDLRIKALLDGAYADFHSTVRRARDPVSLAHSYESPRDREVAAFFAALLAYGNVTTILGSVRRILEGLGPSPYKSLRAGHLPAGLETFRHRFTTGDDIAIVSLWLTQILKAHGTIEAFFVAGSVPADAPIKDHLSDFVTRIFGLKLPPAWAKVLGARSRNLRYLVSDPAKGSACKRLNMYLRWMVRPADGIDLGLWTRLRADQLVLPVDTHLLQTLRALRWTRAKSASWKVAEEATRRLRLYSPEDPVRYDFALCHLSMAGNDIRKYKSRGGTVLYERI